MQQKRVLILYISDISGHRSAGLALEKAIKQVSPQTEILNINAFKQTNPLIEKITNRIYMFVIKKAPKLWEAIYDKPLTVKILSPGKKLAHRINEKKLKRIFDSFDPDVIICTQAYPCGMVADYKKRNKLKAVLVAALTDYVPHSFWIYDTVDYYICPSEEVARRMVKKGVPEKKIRSLGIPIDPKFGSDSDRDKITKGLSLDPKVPTILIMGGSHGLGPIEAIVNSLEGFKGDLQEIIVCGSNPKLHESLKSSLKDFKKKIRLFGFADNIHELMSASDIIVTKPGGITSSEALAKKLPLVIIKPIPGQEQNNTEFLVEKNAAIRIDEPKDINKGIEKLFSEPETLKAMSKAVESIRKPNSGTDIAKFILNL